jgi:hypothetical protein
VILLKVGPSLAAGDTQVTVGALDDSDGAALAVGNASLRLPLAIVGRHCVGEDTQDLAKQSSVEGQRKHVIDHISAAGSVVRAQ